MLTLDQVEVLAGRGAERFLLKRYQRARQNLVKLGKVLEANPHKRLTFEQEAFGLTLGPDE